MGFAVCQLGLDLREHVVRHHRAQALDVGTVPGILQRDEVGFAGLEETFGIKPRRNAPGLGPQQRRTYHRPGSRRSRVLLVGIKGHAIALPGARRRIVADIFGAVVPGCLGIARPLERQRRLTSRRARRAGRLALEFAHDEANHQHDQQRQQGEHDDLAEGAAQTEGRGQPGQAQACGQAAQHGTPRFLRCRGCRRGRGFGCGIGTRRRRFALRDVGRLPAKRLAAAQACGLGRGPCQSQGEHQRSGKNCRPNLHNVSLNTALCLIRLINKLMSFNT